MSTQSSLSVTMDNKFFFNHSVEEAVRLNKELTYINLHQKCIVTKQQEDVKELQTALVEVKGQLSSKDDHMAPLVELRNENVTLKTEISIVRADFMHHFFNFTNSMRVFDIEPLSDTTG